MNFTPLSLEGCFQINPEVLSDARGAFARTYCADEFAKHGLETSWAQINTSVTACAGTIRGIHFQRPPRAEAKLIRCVRGTAWDVAVDLREGSKTFGKWLALELSAANMTMVYIPQGFGHAFQALAEETELVYLHSAFYSPSVEGGVNFADPDLAIDWPLPATNVSKRDLELPALADLEPIG